VTLTIKGIAKPNAVTLLTDGTPLTFDASDDGVSIQLPASKRTHLVDVVRVELAQASAQAGG
jgi:hypothetical protein